MKTCTVCKAVKPREDFYKRKLSKDGLTPRCKICHVADCKARSDRNPEAAKKRASDWYYENNDRAKLTRKLYRTANKEKDRKVIYAWRARNPAKLSSYRANRRAAKLRATPKFHVDDELNRFATESAYALAKLRTQATGFAWHVDHIVPLQSEFVCGLHWYANLRVIPAKENQMKSNRFWEHQ